MLRVYFPFPVLPDLSCPVLLLSGKSLPGKAKSILFVSSFRPAAFDGFPPRRHLSPSSDGAHYKSVGGNGTLAGSDRRRNDSYQFQIIRFVSRCFLLHDLRQRIVNS